jgi:DNA-binding transcriptional ArsR family regulator
MKEMRQRLTVLVKLQALSNETRFKIVDLVRDKEMTAGAIARHFELTRPAVSQHIGILRAAGLLDERRTGAQRLYATNGENFGELVEYVEIFWRSRLRRLKQAAETIERSKRNK